MPFQYTGPYADNLNALMGNPVPAGANLGGIENALSWLGVLNTGQNPWAAYNYYQAVGNGPQTMQYGSDWGQGMSSDDLMSSAIMSGL